jgi:hypothetical protein
MTLHEMQQRDLICSWQLALHLKVTRDTPKEQAPRERKQMEFSRKVGPFHCLWKISEGLKVQEVLHTLQ